MGLSIQMVRSYADQTEPNSNQVCCLSLRVSSHRCCGPPKYRKTPLNYSLQSDHIFGRHVVAFIKYRRYGFGGLFLHHELDELVVWACG